MKRGGVNGAASCSAGRFIRGIGDPLKLKEDGLTFQEDFNTAVTDVYEAPWTPPVATGSIEMASTLATHTTTKITKKYSRGDGLEVSRKIAAARAAAPVKRHFF